MRDVFPTDFSPNVLIDTRPSSTSIASLIPIHLFGVRQCFKIVIRCETVPAMSLYFDAASILADTASGGSLKSRIYNQNPKAKQKTKAPPAQIYALIIESSKWDTVLKEVIDKAGVLAAEPKVSPSSITTSEWRSHEALL